MVSFGVPKTLAPPSNSTAPALVAPLGCHGGTTHSAGADVAVWRHQGSWRAATNHGASGSGALLPGMAGEEETPTYPALEEYYEACITGLRSSGGGCFNRSELERTPP